MAEENQTQALHLKTLAEETYTSSQNLSAALSYAADAHRLSPSLDGLPELLTAFRILSAASENPHNPNWYEVLQTEPFSQTTVVKKQYRKLALALHPDKNAVSACGDAFKVVAEGFRVLSDREKKREFDTRLRVAMQDGVEREREEDGFWTVCGGCGNKHWFGRKYLGHRLMCSGCKKSFRALEVGSENEESGIRARKRKTSSVGEVLERSMGGNGELGNASGVVRSKKGKGKRGSEEFKLKKVEIGEDEITLAEVLKRSRDGNRESGGDDGELRSKRGVGRRVLDEFKLKRAEIGEDEVTLAEVLKTSRDGNRESGGDDGELRSKRGVGKKVLDESKLKRAEIGEDEITLAEVLKRSMGANGESGSDDGELRSKRGVGKKVLDESKLKRAEIGEDDITLAEVLGRSMGKNGESGNTSGVLKSKRGVGKKVSDESKLKRAEIGEDDITLTEVLERSRGRNGELGSDDNDRELRSKRGKGTRDLDESKLKRAEIGEDDITLAEVFKRSRGGNSELGSNNNIELRLKRGKGTRVSDESKLKIVEISEDEITLAEVLERVKPGSSKGGSDNKVSRSKKGARTEVSDDSKSNRAEIEEEGITLADEIERSLPVTGELGSEDRVLRSKRGVASAEISEDDITSAEVLDRSMQENGELGNNSRVLRSKRRKTMRVSDDSKSNEAENEEEGITLTDVLESSMQENGELGGNSRVLRSKRRGSMRVSDDSKSNGAEFEEEGITVTEVLGSSIPENGELGNNNRVLRSKRGVGTRISDESESNRSNIVEGTTLTDMQTRAKRKVREEKMRLRGKEKRKEGEKVEKICENKKRRKVSDNGNLEIMAVEDSDFYDFDKDRVARSFKKGQVWAVYDDDDGMPRRYGLIDDVSVYPFKIKLSFLDLESNANEVLTCDKTGVRISCGRFKLAKQVLVDSVNVFSYLVDAERASREVYRIYPKKGSVWALFNEKASPTSDKSCYDIVVCLTSFDETYGLSMGHLQKVDGFKSVFKRREKGCHAIRWLAKADFQLFSHQIPARKLSGEEAPDLSTDCWELDPASLPPEMLRICH